MNFSKFWQCCFPNKKENVVNDEEESVDDFTYSPEEKKIKMQDTFKGKKEEDEYDMVKSKLQGKIMTNTSNSNSPYEHNKKQPHIGGNSFTSFGAAANGKDEKSPGQEKKLSESVKKTELGGGVKSNVENSINLLKDISTKKDAIDLNTNTSIKAGKDTGGYVLINPSGATNSNKTNNNSNVNSNSNLMNESIIKKGDETFDIANNSHRFISEEEIKNAPELVMEEIKGDMLKNIKLVINAAGLATGLRKAKDGLVFFGTSAKQKDEYFLNDVELNYLDNDLGTNRIFYIYYKKESNKFYLKNYNKAKVKMHIKLSSEYFYPLIKKEIILIDEMYFQLIPHPEGKLEMINLGIATYSDKKVDKENSKAKYIFEKNEYKSVTIGRDPNCTISFPGDKSFSKVHTTIVYDKEKSIWRIKDGASDKPSTNGTWLFANHSYEITDNTIFQLGNSNFFIKMK